MTDADDAGVGPTAPSIASVMPAETHTHFDSAAKAAGGDAAAFNTHFSDDALLRKDGKVVLARTKLSGTATYKDCYEALMSDAGGFFGKYHDKRGAYQGPNQNEKRACEFTPWAHAADAADANTAMGWRKLECTTVVQAPWSMHTPYVEHHRYMIVAGGEGDAPPSIVFQISSQTPKVTYGDYFRVETVIDFTFNPGGGCDVAVTAHVHFFKTPMGFKGKIQSTATTELTTGYAKWIVQAKKAVAKVAPKEALVANDPARDGVDVAAGGSPATPAPSIASVMPAETHTHFDSAAKAAGGDAAAFNTHFSDDALLRKDGKVVLARTKLSGTATYKDCYEALMSDAGGFFGKYHDKRGAYQGPNQNEKRACEFTPWAHAADAADANTAMGWRKLECTTVVQAPWSMHTPYVEHHRYMIVAGGEGDAPPSIVFQISSQTPKVTYGDYFRVETVIDFTFAAGGGCDVAVTAHVHFFKTPMGFKGKIQSTATTELTTGYAKWIVQAQQAVAKVGGARGVEGLTGSETEADGEESDDGTDDATASEAAAPVGVTAGVACAGAVVALMFLLFWLVAANAAGAVGASNAVFAGAVDALFCLNTHVAAVSAAPSASAACNATLATHTLLNELSPAGVQYASAHVAQLHMTFVHLDAALANIARVLGGVLAYLLYECAARGVWSS